jgi:hypothetical protein
LVRARQTFDLGAARTTVFWIRSVTLGVPGALLVVLMTRTS